MDTLTVDSTCGKMVNVSDNPAFANIVSVENVRARFASPPPILPTADITIKSSAFSSDMLNNGLPKSGLRLHIIDDVFGDHVYTIVGAEQTDPLFFDLRCLID